MADSYSITARRSGAQDSVVDNGSAQVTVSGGTFRPTELLLGGLGSCMLAMLVDYAERNDMPADGIAVDVTGEMESRPRRIARIHAVITLPSGLTQTQIDALLRASHKCTVHATLEQSPEITVALAPTAQA